jgi:hypothetical protein
MYCTFRETSWQQMGKMQKRVLPDLSFLVFFQQIYVLSTLCAAKGNHFTFVSSFFLIVFFNHNPGSFRAQPSRRVWRMESKVEKVTLDLTGANAGSDLVGTPLSALHLAEPK